MAIKAFLKSIYDRLPLKKEVFSFIKLIWSPPERVYKHLHFRGVFTVDANKGRKFKIYHHGHVVENEIFWSGLQNGWEKKSIELWIKLCEDAHTILDVGANSGIYALIAKAINKNAEVHCFEPIPEVYKLLEKNIALNGYDIITNEIALSDHSGKASIYLPVENDFAYSVTVNKNTTGNIESKGIEIEILDLASYINTHNISGIDLMKIDVETHEVEVLKGMGTYLKQFKPTMIIEILENEIAEKLNELLKGMGYAYFNINDADGTLRKEDKLTKSDYYNYLVCSPETAAKIGL